MRGDIMQTGLWQGSHKPVFFKNIRQNYEIIKKSRIKTFLLYTYCMGLINS